MDEADIDKIVIPSEHVWFYSPTREEVRAVDNKIRDGTPIDDLPLKDVYIWAVSERKVQLENNFGVETPSTLKLKTKIENGIRIFKLSHSLGLL